MDCILHEKLSEINGAILVLMRLHVENSVDIIWMMQGRYQTSLRLVLDVHGKSKWWFNEGQPNMHV